MASKRPNTPLTSHLHTLTHTALMTATLCILAPFSIPLPFSPVPLSCTTFVLYLWLFLFPRRTVLLSFTLYLLLGCLGLPIFSSFRGGIAHLIGPTGGYLLGMYALLFIGNVFVNQAPNRFSLTIRCLIGFVIGTALCYLIGSIWLATLLHLSLTQAIAIGVLPYLAGDFLKIILALKLGPLLQKRLAVATGDFVQ